MDGEEKLAVSLPKLSTSSVTFADDETVTHSFIRSLSIILYRGLKRRPCVMNNAISITAYLVKNVQNTFIE